MRIGTAFLHVHRRRSFPFAITAVMISRCEHHGLVGAQLGETIVAPVRGKLCCELRVIFLQGHIATAISQFTNYHSLSPSSVAYFARRMIRLYSSTSCLLYTSPSPR